MSQGDKALRARSIPFLSEPLEGLTAGFFDYGYLHIQQPELTTNRVKAIPMTRPEKGDITEAYLFMEMTAPSDRALNVEVAIGRWTESGGDPTIVPVQTYTDAEIAQDHRKLTGLDSPFTVAANGTLTIDVNLLQSIPLKSDSNYLSDMFVLLVAFNSGVSSANGYELNKFKLTCSAQMGLGR